MGSEEKNLCVNGIKGRKAIKAIKARNIWQNIKNGLHVYRHYLSMNIRSVMQYKVSFFLSVIGQCLVSFNVFLGIFFLFQRFSSVKGFTYSEVLLCYSIVLLEFHLAEMWARGFDRFDAMVRKAEFDRILLRPRNEILQVLGSKFEMTRIGRLFQAVILFGYGVTKSGITWTIPKIFTVIFMLIGGIGLFSGIFMLYAAFCFFTLDGLEFMNILTDGAREYGKYPIGVYGKRALQFATFVVPYALVQYYPLLYLLERETSVFYVFLPLAATIFIVPCYCFWRYGVKKYQSSGS